MAMQVVQIPPVGTLAARAIIFHSLYDCEHLGEGRFFENPHAFAKGERDEWDEDGKLVKARGFRKIRQECNLEGAGGGLPAGYQKDVVRVSVRVFGARDDDVFWVSIFAGAGDKPTVGPLKCRRRGTVAVKFEGKPLRIVELERFWVEVKGPDRLKGNYTKVELLGPLLVASMV